MGNLAVGADSANATFEHAVYLMNPHERARRLDATEAGTATQDGPMKEVPKQQDGTEGTT